MVPRTVKLRGHVADKEENGRERKQKKKKMKKGLKGVMEMEGLVSERCGSWNGKKGKRGWCFVFFDHVPAHSLLNTLNTE